MDNPIGNSSLNSIIGPTPTAAKYTGGRGSRQPRHTRTARHTDSQTITHPDSQTPKRADRQTTDTDRQPGAQADTQTDRHGQTTRRTGGQTDTQTADRRADTDGGEAGGQTT